MLTKHICMTVRFSAFYLASSAADAGRLPCSGKMGGIARCVDGKFLCNNGKFSRSKKVCDPTVYGGSRSGNAAANRSAGGAKGRMVLNSPCSGKMGGIARCVEGKFLCNDGNFSRSKKVCDPTVYGGTSSGQ